MVAEKPSDEEIAMELTLKFIEKLQDSLFTVFETQKNDITPEKIGEAYQKILQAVKEA
ncbi:MAG: hypothetical protein MPW14_03695 [Candidatus Manganitrophus sp.]|jgi:hypothetical protein|uniref:hypothetical protein n=1 Tax=Candidatus Manganitrophus noduliformans TaxID=2606439 RepID=UPI00143B505A|nr:hypothetical protein [Candidatus Manganitrophus noduliformans]MCG3113708.1 hypothetical protein [Candidatus Manganitrophus morganii]MDC4203334.1 hypothetical protein [Candidatus Manganitrophus sp.]MCG3117075.1 hypothetical protein [Candidatus Manganitrophus morganii]MDC4227134.1 hypothetical protein [Candidatus Manganitrophus sp.]WDT71730.1 MAG: hypothetical protein MPW17_02485 [Candidatus Manganitrophus sp.]